jgi:Mrp family chromosome partitioning ATPase
MDRFKNRARDIMASVTSQYPDRPSLAVTSPRRGDGQTELAIRLALAAAKRVDYRVLLVDFDIRKPQIAARLGLSSKYFVLGDVLRSSCLLGEALLYSEEDNLYVLPARPLDREGDDVLADRQVQAVMAQMHATFDFTIIGCGPMEHVDATIVCRHAGVTALAAFCGRTPARTLREAAEALGEAGVAVAGLLLTGSEG